MNQLEKVSRISLMLGGFWLIAIILLNASCSKKRSESEKDVIDNGLPVSNLSGKELSYIHCQSCHVYTEPALIDKATWEKNVLIKMGHFMGIYIDTLRDDLIEGGKAGELIRAAGVFPEEPSISLQDWQKIVDYYVSEAPETLPEQERPERKIAPLKGFKVKVPEFRTQPPMTTYIKMDTEQRVVYVGDAKGDISSLTLLDPSFNILNTVYMPTPPSGVHRIGDSLCITMMGRVWPTDNPSGQLIKAFKPPNDDRYRHFVRLVEELQRPVHTAYGDLTHNGLDDVLVCEYGNYTGSLSWYENKGDGYKKHVLLSQPGAIKAYITDMDGDGNNDIIALMAQGDEALWIFYNLGNGKFRPDRVLRFSPSWGSVYFELVDFNKDGHLDVLYCNGDNGDYYPVLKDYHGVRIFENDGNNQFEEVFFFPMDGVYKASAVDFDNDGDLDIFAIAFYPDFTVHPRESILYLENTGKYNYTVRGLEKEIPGRWITFDIGDLDGDGDMDILLGSYTGFTTFVDTTGTMDEKLRAGNSLLYLENTLK
jgi:hypothetical protein